MDVSLPDGTIITDVPEGTTQAELLRRLKAGGYDVSWAEPKPSTVLGEAKRGFQQFISGARTGAGLLGGSPEEAAIAGVERSQKIAEEAGEGPSLERIKRVYEERGLLPAAGQVASDIPRLLAQQGTQIGATLGGARLGAMAGSPFGPVGTVVGGTAGAVLANVPSMFGQSGERQAEVQMQEGKPVDISRGRAALSTAGSAALEAAGTAGVLGKQAVKRILGISEDAALAAARSRADLVKAAQATIAGGVVRGAAIEMPVEVAQSVLDRWQAGLDVTSDDAMKEYGESMYAAGLVGGPIGGVSTIPSRRAAQQALADSEPLAPGQRRGETLEQTANRLNVEVKGLTEQLKPPAPSPILSSEQLASMAAEPDGYAKLIQYEESIKDEPRSPEKVAARQAARELRARLEIEAQQRQTPADKPYPYDPFAPEPFQFKSSTELVDLINKIEDPADKLVRLLEYRAEVKNQPASAEREQALKDAGALYNEINKFAQEQGFPAPKPFTLRASDLIAAGIAKKDPLFEQLKNKDINKPDDVDTVVKLTEDAQRRPDITPELFDRLEGLLTSVEAHIKDKPGSGFYGQRTYPKPSGTGVPVAGEPKPSVPTGGIKPSGSVGMVGPVSTPERAVSRKTAPPAPVKPVISDEAALAETFPPASETAFEPGLDIGEPEPDPELVAAVRKLEEDRAKAEKTRVLPRGQIYSLFSAVKGKLDRSDTLDISPDKSMRALTSKSGGTFVSELVNNGQLDKWLPPNMRPEGGSYDVNESTEYIKDLLRNRNHIPYAVKEKLEMLDLQIRDLDQAIEQEKQLDILIRQTNAQLQAAAAERRVEEAELPAAERPARDTVRAEGIPARAQIAKPEPFTIDVEARVVEDTVGAEVKKLPASQITLLENHYGEKSGTQSFLNKVKEDVVLFANKGASAVAEAIRSIIRAIHAGVISISLIFNPININQPEALLIVPKVQAQKEAAKPEAVKPEIPAEEIKQRESKLAQLPDNVEGMSDAAKQAYQTLIPSLKDQIGDKLIIIADKPNARLFVFTNDGKLVTQNKALFGAAKGDLYNGNVNVPSNRITPAGLFGLKLVDAKTSPSAKRTAGEYDFGKVFALEDPEAVITIMHSVWLKDSDAAMRQAALRSPDATDSRYSYGCINVDQQTFKYLLDNHERQMDGAKLFVVPDNQAQIKDFLYGDVAKNIGGLKPGEGPDRLVREAITRMSLAKVAPQVSERKFKELERKAKAPSKPAPAKEEPEEVKAIRADREQKVQQLQGVLEKILAKYGLKDIKINLEEGMQDEGSFSGQIIKLALDLESPVRTLRHESIHALKELGFFTPQQWKVLTDRAKSEWVDKYLKNQSALVNGKEVSRYDAYMDLYKGDEDAIVEEAIADAFGDFSKAKPPAGMMQAILKRMENLFKAIRQAFNQSGYQTAEDVFGAIEEGKLTKAEKLVQQVDAKAKPSLRSPIGLYSELENKIEAVPSKSAPPEQWKNLIKSMPQKGVKPEEIEWSGVNDWLDLQTGKVAKDDLLNYLRANGVQVEEVVLGNQPPDKNRVAQSMFSRPYNELTEGQQADVDYMVSGEGAFEAQETARMPKYAGYQLPGGENYREVLITLPATDKDPVAGLSPARAAPMLFDGRSISQLTDEEKNVVYKAVNKPSNDFISKHWSQKNVLAHIRLNDRTDAEGNKVLFVEEIQSDWGQEGKKKGFQGQPRFVEGMRDQPEGFIGVSDSGIPAAPFVTKTEGWLNLALKRIMVMAAEGDYEKVAFVTGPQSAERYDLSKQVDDLRYGDGMLVALNGGTIVVNKKASPKELPDLVGKEIAERLLKAPEMPGNGYRRLTGLDLKVGGEGMKAFYDKIVPIAVNKLLPKVGGGKMELVDLLKDSMRKYDSELMKADAKKLGEEGFKAKYAHNEQPGFSVTPEMKEKVATTGLPKFSLRAPSTSEFKTFFGNSKIVDKDGEPKVMYHGTARDITSFVPKQAGGIFLTDDPKFAETFSKMSADWMAKHADQFLSPEQLKAGRSSAVKQINKDYKADPKLRDKLLAALDDPNSMYYTDANEILAAQYKDQLPTGPNIMPVYVRAENPFDFDNPEHIRQIQQYEAENKYTPNTISDKLSGVERGSWEAIEDRLVQQAIKQLGFDGFYVKETGKKNLAVYGSDQIKSAIGNQGTYDLTNADIRFSLRPLPTLSTDVLDRVSATVIPRERPGMVDRLLDAFSPRVFSKFRTEFVNRYDALAKLDRQVAEQIRLMGGAGQLADAKAESAALFSDIGGGLTASAMGVHDRKGGIPVYVRKFIVEKDFQQVGPDYPTRALAEAAAKRLSGAQVFEQGYTAVSNANGVEGLISIFSPLMKYQKPEGNAPSVFDQYQFWADVKRASKYILNPSTGKYEEKLFTKDDIRRAKEIEQAYPEFVDIQKAWTKYNDGLVAFMRDTGVISEAGAREMTKHGDYFPFYRHLGEDDVEGPRLFQSIANVKSVKTAKGSEAPVTDFFETIVRNTQSAIQSGIKNVAARRATDQALRIQEVFKLPNRAAGPSIYRVLEDGKETYYQAQDPLFIESLKSLNQPDLPFIGLFAAPARLLRNLVTKDPAFQLANMMRDSFSAYVSSGFKFTPMVATLKEYGSIIAKKSPEFDALLKGGVIGGYDYSRGVEVSAEKLEADMRKAANARTKMEKITSPVTSLWGALEKSSEASDAATRIAVYKRVLAETGNEAEAMYQALEVMNFNRKGRSPIIRVLTAAVPFMNARIQGLDVLYRSGFRPIFGKDATEQEKARLKTFWVRGATMMALSSMYWLLTSDEEEYKKQEQETRDNYWLFPSAGIKIPIPFEIGVMFKVVPERILEYAFGSDTGKDFTKAAARHFLSTFGFNPIPQTFLPAIEATANYSFFTQRPILGQGLENVAPEYQVGPNTSKISAAIGESLGISPIKLDYLIQGYTGTMGMYAVNLFDSIFSMNDEAPKPSKRLEQMPVLRRFMVDPEARGQVTAYYDLKNSVDQVVRTSNYLERSMDFEQYGKYMQENIKLLAARDYINDLEKTMKEFREIKNSIRVSKMDADDKRDSLTNIGRMEQQLTQNIRTLKKQLAEQ